ncbi:MAG: hypothetical protein BWY78_00287 [Alphaproteobacteria bacterium ADurb.Bin438]|nr:MAG: hypothetical protein BWY78_00287 [Alphaproteobacteria bacterium ADurb.Bin438]
MSVTLKENSRLKEIQKEIVRLRGERNFSTDLMHITLLLCEEMGEMLAQIRRPFIDGKQALPEEDKSSLKHEIADVFILLNALADKVGVDLEDAWLSKEHINDNREWKK